MAGKMHAQVIQAPSTRTVAEGRSLCQGAECHACGGLLGHRKRWIADGRVRQDAGLNLSSFFFSGEFFPSAD
jgi:hypothetical protein